MSQQRGASDAMKGAGKKVGRVARRNPCLASTGLGESGWSGTIAMVKLVRFACVSELSQRSRSGACRRATGGDVRQECSSASVKGGLRPAEQLVQVALGPQLAGSTSTAAAATPCQPHLLWSTRTARAATR